MIDCINGPCEIVSFEKYDTLDYPPNNLFFTRASYDLGKRKIEPPIEHWVKHCICKTPMNPDLLYVQCDNCDGWYHTQCIGISIEEAEALEKYYCYVCQNSRPEKSSGKIRLSLVPTQKKALKQSKKSSMVRLSKDQIVNEALIIHDKNTQEIKDNTNNNNKNNPLQLSTERVQSSDKEINNLTMSQINLIQRIKLKDVQENLNDLFENLSNEDEESELPKEQERSVVQQEYKGVGNTEFEIPLNFGDDNLFTKNFELDLKDLKFDYPIEFQKDLTSNLFESLDSNLFQENYLQDIDPSLFADSFFVSEKGGVTEVI